MTRRPPVLIGPQNAARNAVPKPVHDAGQSAVDLGFRERPRRAFWPSALLALLSSAACAVGSSACSKTSDEANEEARRLWGRERLASEVERRAADAIDPYVLGENDALRARVLGMDFEEVVARLGFVEYKGVARFNLSGGPGSATIALVEDTLIQHGLNGTFLVLQRDGDGNIMRETIFTNGVYFVRNGGGEMRVQGVIKDQRHVVRDEGWQPLRVYTTYFGPRLKLKKVGRATAEGRPAARYAFELGAGPEIVPGPTPEEAKRPKSLRGELFVDEAKGVPLKATLEGVLELPSGKGNAPGRLEIGLDFSIKVVPGIEIKPKSFIPTIKRHPVDLAPLAFLDGGTRTSTVIGGKRPKVARPPEDLDTETSSPAGSKPN